MLPSDPFISFWTSYRRPGRARAGFLPRVGRSDAKERTRAVGAGKRSRPGSELLARSRSLSLSLLRSPSLPSFSSPRAADRWAGCSRCSGSADSAICAGVRDAAAAGQPDGPSPLHPPPPPTSLCWLLHLSLTLGFRVLTVHSAFFISSSLSFHKKMV